MGERYLIITSVMACNIADGFMDEIISHICDYASLRGSIVILKIHIWCTIVFWVCGMQVEYMCICSTINNLCIP